MTLRAWWMVATGMAAIGVIGLATYGGPGLARAEVLHTHTSQVVRVGVNVGNGDLYVQLVTPVPTAWTTCATNYSYVKIDLDTIPYPDGVLAMLYTAVNSGKDVSFVIGDGSTSCYGDSATFKSVYIVQ